MQITQQGLSARIQHRDAHFNLTRLERVRLTICLRLLCHVYNCPQPRDSRSAVHTLSVRIGAWFEAHATGAGVAVVPLVVVLVLAAAIVRAWLG